MTFKKNSPVITELGDMVLVDTSCDDTCPSWIDLVVELRDFNRCVVIRCGEGDFVVCHKMTNGWYNKPWKVVGL